MNVERELIKRQMTERAKQAEFEKYAKEHNLFVCSTNVLEQIKTEIQKVMDRERDLSTDNAKAQYIALGWCLELIDKYTKGVSHESHEADD